MAPVHVARLPAQHLQIPGLQGSVFLRSEGLQAQAGGVGCSTITTPCSCNQKMNDYLKDLCELCEFNTPITRITYRAGKREEWRALEANSSVATDELQIINGGEEEIHQLQLTNYEDFPIVAFMSIGFSHHSAILAGAKSLEERKYYIQLCYDQKLSVDEVQKKIADGAFHTQGEMPNNFIATIPEYKRAFRAIQMFKDEYLLDYINVEQLGERDEDIDERGTSS